MSKNIMVYIVLIGILVILVIAGIILSAANQNKTQIQPTIPTPTTVIIPITGKPAVTNQPLSILPTKTGGNEDIPVAMRDVSIQKQALRKKTPMKQTAFTIEFNYADDNFVITLNEPKAANRQLFDDWLKQNYPLIPASEFIFK